MWSGSCGVPVAWLMSPQPGETVNWCCVSCCVSLQVAVALAEAASLWCRVSVPAFAQIEPFAH